MFTTFLTILLVLFSMLKTPMSMLIFCMLSIISVTLWFFLETMDYWYAFLIIMSFLVGLFLLFVYLVSLSQDQSFSGPKKNVEMSKGSIFFFFTTTLIVSLTTNSENFMVLTGYSKNSSQGLEWMFENSNEIILMCLALFGFFIIFLFFFMKKNKKMMKSSG